jgi:CheY-like chemotaxis protein
MNDTSSVSPTPGANPRRVLVVDDSVDGAQAMALLLKYDGHDARIAHNGQDAIAEARDFLPDVVFLDIGLPGMSGYEVARELRADPKLRDVVLIALTGWGTDEDRRRTREAGFDHHFVKPVDLDAVESVLRDLPARR